MFRLSACLRLLLVPLFGVGIAHAAPACKPGQPVDESGFVDIGGIAQWVTVSGDDCANPVLLYVHGGPGNPTSVFGAGPFASWRKHITLAQWDQRGSGMTWGRHRPGEEVPLSVEQLRDDGVDVARYLTQRFGKHKVILLGSSWGSMIGANMAKEQPGLFCAYVGVAQLVGYRDNNTSWSTVIARARADGDTATITQLEALGPPPWTNPRNFGIVRRAVRNYETKRIDPTPPSWFDVLPQYATPQAKADYTEGEDYSFLKFVGWKGDGMASTMDLYRLGTRYELPVYLVQGEEDLLTEPKVTRRFFDAITAPDKALVEVPRAGHDPNGPLIDAQRQVLAEKLQWRCD